MKKNLFYYFILLVVGFGIVWLTLGQGQNPTNSVEQQGLINNSANQTNLSLSHFTDRLLESRGIFILQLIVIMIIARIMGFLFQIIGQPMVIGEIIAGLLLGPSILGAISPQAAAFLFPEQSIEVLKQLSQIGLIFFMFIIGMELDIHSFRKSADKALLISISSIAFPFVSGIVVAFFLYSDFSSPQVPFSSFALFVGTTMCITAFPILARIAQERKLTRTPLGNMAISAAAIGDVIAWCVLAIVIAIMKSGGLSNSMFTIGLTAVFILFMLFVVKPFMYRIGKVYSSREAMSKPIIALVFLLILISTLAAELIGINALFGAFMAGVTMPENLSFKRVFTEKIEDVSLVILLPLFFVSTGLRTEIGLINSWHLWTICILVILVATLSKFGGTVLAARFVGQSWHNSLVVGTLMNSRGLMELIVLNIGYDMGLLNPELFTMLVLMALITTLFTGPGLNLIAVFQPKKEKEIHIEKAYKVLLSFANPKMGGALLDLTRQLIIRTAPDTLFTALHISPRTDLSPDDARIFERESFIPIRAVAEKNNLTLSTIYVNTHEIHSEIIQTCRHEKPDFLILGSARSVFSTDILGGILRKILNESPCDTLIFNERSFKRIRSVLLISYGNGDDYLFDYARLLNHAGGVKFHACNMGSGLTESGPVFEDAGIPLNTVSDSLLQTEFLHTIDLVLIADMNWRTLEGEQHVPLGQFPSLLIIHKGSNENRILG